MKVVEKEMMMKEQRVGKRGVSSETRQRLYRMMWCKIRPLVESQALCWRKSDGREEEK